METKEAYMNTLKIKAQMKLLSLKQETLAPMLGVTISTLNKYINNPELMTIKKAKELCTILHMEIGEIV
jgi:DNA-binding XRE family transcriptional regulator